MITEISYEQSSNRIAAPRNDGRMHPKPWPPHHCSPPPPDRRRSYEKGTAKVDKLTGTNLWDTKGWTFPENVESMQKSIAYEVQSPSLWLRMCCSKPVSRDLLYKKVVYWVYRCHIPKAKSSKTATTSNMKLSQSKYLFYPMLHWCIYLTFPIFRQTNHFMRVCFRPHEVHLRKSDSDPSSMKRSVEPLAKVSVVKRTPDSRQCKWLTRIRQEYQQ